MTDTTTPAEDYLMPVTQTTPAPADATAETTADRTPGVPAHKAVDHDPSDENGDHVPDWLIPDRLYDVLKWAALILLPALSVLVAALGPVWGWGDLAGQISTTVNAVGLFVGAVIGVSAIKGGTR